MSETSKPHSMSATDLATAIRDAETLLTFEDMDAIMEVRAGYLLARAVKHLEEQLEALRLALRQIEDSFDGHHRVIASRALAPYPASEPLDEMDPHIIGNQIPKSVSNQDRDPASEPDMTLRHADGTPYMDVADYYGTSNQESRPE